jgi:hypothetical protein
MVFEAIVFELSFWGGTEWSYGCSTSAPMSRKREDFWPIIAIEGAQMGRKSGPVKLPAE